MVKVVVEDRFKLFLINVGTHSLYELVVGKLVCLVENLVNYHSNAILFLLRKTGLDYLCKMFDLQRLLECDVFLVVVGRVLIEFVEQLIGSELYQVSHALGN